VDVRAVRAATGFRRAVIAGHPEAAVEALAG